MLRSIHRPYRSAGVGQGHIVVHAYQCRCHHHLAPRRPASAGAAPPRHPAAAPMSFKSTSLKGLKGAVPTRLQACEYALGPGGDRGCHQDEARACARCVLYKHASRNWTTIFQQAFGLVGSSSRSKGTALMAARTSMPAGKYEAEAHALGRAGQKAATERFCHVTTLGDRKFATKLRLSLDCFISTVAIAATLTVKCWSISTSDVI